MPTKLASGRWYCEDCNTVFSPADLSDVKCPQCGDTQKKEIAQGEYPKHHGYAPSPLNDPAQGVVDTGAGFLVTTEDLPPGKTRCPKCSAVHPVKGHLIPSRELDADGQAGRKALAAFYQEIGSAMAVHHVRCPSCNITYEITTGHQAEASAEKTGPAARQADPAKNSTSLEGRFQSVAKELIAAKESSEITAIQAAALVSPADPSVLPAIAAKLAAVSHLNSVVYLSAMFEALGPHLSSTLVAHLALLWRNYHNISSVERTIMAYREYAETNGSTPECVVPLRTFRDYISNLDYRQLADSLTLPSKEYEAHVSDHDRHELVVSTGKRCRKVTERITELVGLLEGAKPLAQSLPPGRDTAIRLIDLLAAGRKREARALIEESPLRSKAVSSASAIANMLAGAQDATSASMPAGATIQKSGCFLATACYGSAVCPEVLILRRYRDEHLLSNRLGSWLVRVYYRLSPPVAVLLRRSPVLRYVVRVCIIAPVVQLLRPVPSISRKRSKTGRLQQDASTATNQPRGRG